MKRERMPYDLSQANLAPGVDCFISEGVDLESGMRVRLVSVEGRHMGMIGGTCVGLVHPEVCLFFSEGEARKLLEQLQEALGVKPKDVALPEWMWRGVPQEHDFTIQHPNHISMGQEMGGYVCEVTAPQGDSLPGDS